MGRFNAHGPCIESGRDKAHLRAARELICPTFLLGIDGTDDYKGPQFPAAAISDRRQLQTDEEWLTHGVHP